MTNLYCLTNFIDFSLAIHQPLKHSNRIKYTCFDISKNFIILGASSGSLYLFNRLGKFLLLIPSKHGCITQLAISANERYVAFATQRSVICVYVINLSAQAAPQVIFTNLCRHQTVQVTCIHWIPDEKLFYYGDSKGQVNLVVLNTFIGTNILNMSVHPILFLDSPIVTIDDYESLLLISNLTKCLLCNTEYEEYKQIGNKPREGVYGACFFLCQQEHTNQLISRIYCSRPGSRVWEVDLDGEVLQTHQFKTALACPPTKIYKHQFGNDNANFASDTDNNDGNDEMLDYPEQNLQFPKLQKLSQDFLLAHNEFAIYIFDMRKSSLVLWCNQFERIIDVRVVHEEIIVFTQTGSLYSVQLRSLQAQACILLQQRKFYECAWMMRKNVKYFADKAREEYDLHVLNQIKHFLIERHQYELLNDLSVIFDAIGQCESSGDTNSSGGSSVITDRSSSLPIAASRFANNQQQKETNNCPQPSVYKLENAFCDNLKTHKGVTKPLKDALLIVTGKFGKNIIKYKFNIFQDEQQKLVKDLIPPEERSLPFKDIKAIYDNGEPEEEIVSRSLKIMSDNQTSMKASNLSVNEEKTIYNLYLICKSSKFSNTHFLERYRSLFDEYTAPELIEILQKLTQLMIDNGDAPEVAQRLCYEMYFHYLNAELIWEMDDSSRQYITEGFKLINNCEDIVRCDHCNFPLRFDTTCQFHELGSTLLRYYWSRNEQIKCFDVLTNTPALFDVLARLYMDEFNIEKVLPIILNYGQPELLNELGKHFTLMTWSQCFEQFVALQQGHLTCINCETTTTVDNINRHFFYTWNCFLNIALEYIQAEDILSLILKWSNFIPNDAIDREFYISCLIKGMI